MPTYTHIIWDWNGTLLDDMDICVEIINRLLSKRGLPLLTLETYHSIFTFPIIDYYHAAGLCINEPFETISTEYISQYMAKSIECGLISGAKDVLSAIQKKGIQQIILSASEVNNLKKQVHYLGVENYFTALLGLDNIHAASKLSIGLEWILQNNIDPTKVLYIGDTNHDYEVAAQMGCKCILVAYGHQPLQKLLPCNAKIIDEIHDVLKELD